VKATDVQTYWNRPGGSCASQAADRIRWENL